MTGPMLELAPPEALGLCPHRWERLRQTAERLCDEGVVTAVSWQVQRRGLTVGPEFCGVRSLEDSEPVDARSIYLIASLTKPIVAMAMLLLVERGLIALNDRVSDSLPEMREGAKRPMTLRHLLTHTSGLPDMLPDNEDLRRANAPLQEFVDRTCLTPLLFSPGRGVLYQSMGYALLGAIIERVAGESLASFLKRELFEPLGMTRTWLGLPDGVDPAGNLAEVMLPESQQNGDDWNWNSLYWRKLGAPWGGAFSTTEDLSRFCRATITGGQTVGQDRLFSPALLREATGNRLYDFPGVAPADARCRGWGLGWRMNWKDHRATFSDLLGEDVFGHWGATGTMCWIDARREAALVLLATRPVDGGTSPLGLLSNMAAAAFLDEDVASWSCPTELTP